MSFWKLLYSLMMCGFLLSWQIWTFSYNVTRFAKQTFQHVFKSPPSNSNFCNSGKDRSLVRIRDNQKWKTTLSYFDFKNHPLLGSLLFLWKNGKRLMMSEWIFWHITKSLKIFKSGWINTRILIIQSLADTLIMIDQRYHRYFQVF